MRDTGTIEKADAWVIDLADASIRQMTDEERRGSRIRFICEDVRLELGFVEAEKLDLGVIEDSIRAQIQMQRPAGLSIVDNRKVVPELTIGSSKHRLLVLHVVKHLLQSTGSHSDKRRRDRVFDLENAIYELENSPS